MISDSDIITGALNYYTVEKFTLHAGIYKSKNYQVAVVGYYIFNLYDSKGTLINSKISMKDLINLIITKRIEL